MKYKAFETTKPIAQNQMDNFVYLYGDQSYLADQVVHRILEKNKINPSQVLAFDGEKLDLDRLSDEVVTVSFGGGKICLVNHFSPETSKDVALKRFQELLPFLGEGNLLIVKEEYKLENARNKRATAQKYRDFAAKSGSLVDCNQPDTNDCIKYLERFADKEKICIGREELRFLFERCGNNMQLTQTELVKISSYALDREIVKSDIEKLNAPSTEVTVFVMINYLFSGDLPSALKLVGRLFEQREEPAMILGALSGNFCDMYRIKAGQNQAMSNEEIRNLFGYKANDFLMKKAISNCKNVSLHQIYTMLNTLYQVDVKLKSSTIDPKILLETALISLRLILSERG